MVYHHGIWVIIENNFNKMNIKIHQETTPHDMHTLMMRMGCLMIEVTPPEISGTKGLSFISCVEIAKHILGIDRRFIITPWQLYCYIGKYKRTK
jgi:hypothetical protein